VAEFLHTDERLDKVCFLFCENFCLCAHHCWKWSKTWRTYWNLNCFVSDTSWRADWRQWPVCIEAFTNSHIVLLILIISPCFLSSTSFHLWERFIIDYELMTRPNPASAFLCHLLMPSCKPGFEKWISKMCNRVYSNDHFITVATNLSIWLANEPLLIRVQTMLLKSMCQAMPFSACALKYIFFDIDDVVKCGLYSYWQWYTPSQWSRFVVDSLGCALWVHSIWPVWWLVSLSIRVQTTLNQIIWFVKFLGQHVKSKAIFIWKWVSTGCLDTH